MVVSFFLGLLGALSQHILYKRLHHTAPEDPEKRIRLVLYGRALAYFSKITFGGCVILCYRQRIWRTFRENVLSVWAIDRLFLATEDLSLFLHWETWGKATLPTLMALVIWLIPIATIIMSPGALTFGVFIQRDTSSLSVPTLNFTAESYKDYRVPVFAKDGTTKKKSLIFVNTTDPSATAPGWFDYYDKPASDIERVSLMSAYSLKNQSLNREDARYRSCGGDFNCTYTISFVGPGYKCEELAHGADDDKKLAELGAPFNTSYLAPVGRLAYFAQVDIGEYLRPQTELGRQGVPLNITNDVGVFKTEPILWIGYSVNTTDPPDPRFKDTWTSKYDPYVFQCIHHETNYTVQYNYTGPFFNTSISHNFLAPIINTTYARYDNGIPNYQDFVPASGFVSPRTDVPLYKKTAVYHAVGQSLRKFLEGKIEVEPPIPGPATYARPYSDITKTRLVKSNSFPVHNLHIELQDFYADMILSLFSAPNLLVIAEDRVEVNTTRYKAAFIYDAGKLWGCYAPVIFFTLIFLIIGAWTVWEDGTTFSVGFSRIMVTTRNSTLDEISRGACLGNDPFPMELMNTRLRFGVLTEGGEEMEYIGSGDGLQGLSHCTFGVASELTAIKRGVPYAGLKYTGPKYANNGLGSKKEKME
ncbi:uncharacterized protein BDR25DRAFT_208566 [Lindgomyces ingoldianus]|uniref:Uncharacterized protein n=1 Tax=Lindgomyces ingoldianus TaxID=673940 RepID=A0ACB6REE0_9PLEO|nr:uncharacterized protein BDR25DRAFT_208566 [Lindgomyces ingoldianus]KAF2477085.1 hypothetical protein BDR25DRAFT_208566 [Lindgomyces ingoldianus]